MQVCGVDAPFWLDGTRTGTYCAPVAEATYGTNESGPAGTSTYHPLVQPVPRPFPCPAGRRADPTVPMLSEADCVTCDAGSACPTGSHLQVPCRPGAFAAAGGSDECAQCAAGEYQPDYGATHCLACPAGFHSPVGASQQSLA